MLGFCILYMLVKGQNADTVNQRVDTGSLPQRNDLCILLSWRNQLMGLILVLPAIESCDIVQVVVMVF
jgi:hypothetical protein